MHRKWLILTFVVLASLIASPVEAQTGVDGSMVGDHGGAYATWQVTLPENQDVTLKLTHYPCTTNDAIGLDVWSPSGRLAQSMKTDACVETASFNTGSGGQATIRMTNYLHNVGTWYNLTADGMTLPGTAPAQPAAPAEAEAAATDTSMAMSAAPSAPAVSASALSAGGNLWGSSAGAFSTHELSATAGTEYKLTLDYSADAGGNWNGIGFEVWGPNGLTASSHPVDYNTESAMFTAGAAGTYTVKVYNYHPMNVWYSLTTSVGSVTPAAAPAAAAPSAELAVNPNPDGDVDCADFPTRAAAQAWWNSHRTDNRPNPGRLDGNGNGLVCESY